LLARRVSEGPEQSNIVLDEAYLSDAKVSRAAAQRLCQYLRVTGTVANRGALVSSTELADAVGVSAAQVRRDLASLGHLGQRGVGYDADGLTSAIRARLGVDRRWRAVLVGVGHLAKALVKYRGLGEHGFDLVGLYDSAPGVVGTSIGGLKVEAVTSLASRVKKLKAELGIITVPAESAQGVADALVSAGLKGLMNFAPVRLKVPSSVQVISVDLAIQLQQLAFRVHFGE
jgi:redox-sensing transcriptional repressor